MAGTIAQRFVQFTQSWPVFIAMALWLAVWSGIHIIPGSWWMDVKYVQVRDVVAGEPVEMIVDRRIRRDFYAQWSVQVRRARGSEGWETIPCGAGANTYRTTSLLPNPLTLQWWSEGKCSGLPPGRYQVSTQWHIYPGNLWPPKRVTALSNVFEVTDGKIADRLD